MRLAGTVVAGLRHAREIGYPTANLAYTLDDGVVLEHGVYAGTVAWADEAPRRAAIVVGGDFQQVVSPKCEAYILDWSGDLYGQQVEFVLTHKLRDLQRFDSLDALKAQIAEDVAQVKLSTVF